MWRVRVVSPFLSFHFFWLPIPSHHFHNSSHATYHHFTAVCVTQRSSLHIMPPGSIPCPLCMATYRPLVFCILSCYKALLSGLGCSARVHRLTQTSMVEMFPGVIIFGYDLRITKSLLRCNLERPQECAQDLPSQVRTRGIEARRWRCCLNLQEGRGSSLGRL